MRTKRIIAKKLLSDFSTATTLDPMQRRYAYALLSARDAAAKRIVLDYAVLHQARPSILLEFCPSRQQWTLPATSPATALQDAKLIYIDAALLPGDERTLMYYFLTLPIELPVEIAPAANQQWFGPAEFATLRSFEVEGKIPTIMKLLGLSAPEFLAA